MQNKNFNKNTFLLKGKSYQKILLRACRAESCLFRFKHCTLSRCLISILCLLRVTVFVIRNLRKHLTNENEASDMIYKAVENFWPYRPTDNKIWPNIIEIEKKRKKSFFYLKFKIWWNADNFTPQWCTKLSQYIIKIY